MDQLQAQLKVQQLPARDAQQIAAEATLAAAKADADTAKAALDKGDLAAAVKEVETLDGASREAFAAWLGQAHARLSADETLIQLESALLVSVGSNPQAARQQSQ